MPLSRPFLMGRGENKLQRCQSAPVITFIALGTAFVLSLTFVPAMLAVALRGNVQERDNGFIRVLKAAYRPMLAKVAATLIDVAITPAVLSDASAALAGELDPQEDQQASAAMRRHLAKVLLARCVSGLLGRTELAGVLA